MKTYSSWAEGKEGELTDQIKKLEQEISDLNDTLDSINAAQMAMAAIAGAAIPAATALGTVFEPLKPVFLVCVEGFYGKKHADETTDWRSNHCSGRSWCLIGTDYRGRQ